MEEGDHWFKKGKMERAMASLNLAVVRAPVKDNGGVNEDLNVAPLSLWLRSNILYSMSEYELALNDVQLALKYQLSVDYKAEAFKRMGMCYLKLGDRGKAVVSLNLAKTCGNKCIQGECTNILSDIEPHCQKPINKISPPNVPATLNDTPGISNSLKLFSDPRYGRYYKAVEPISVGDIVAAEDPYVSALLTEKHGTHCLNCFTRLKAPIPCPNCSGVGFCSTDCLTQGLKYHKWECPYLELIIGSGMSILSLLALRAITQQDLEFFKKAKSKNHIHQKMLNLEAHLEGRDGLDLLRRTLMALFLLQILRHAGYFKGINITGKSSTTLNSSDDDEDEEGIGQLSEDELDIACLLVIHLTVLQYNSHEVYETIIPSNKPYNQGVTNYVGLALYLNSALFNHQCQPTLARYFYGKRIILRAQHPICVNEEVSENYGPVFTMRNKEQRHKALSGRYLFVCHCQACEMDWPTLRNMKPETAFYRCKQKDCRGSVSEIGLCQVCKQKQTTKEDKLLFYSYQDDWNIGAELLKVKNYSEAEKVIKQYINDMWKLVCQPSKNLCLAMEALRTMWANTSGNISILRVQDDEEGKNAQRSSAMSLLLK